MSKETIELIVEGGKAAAGAQLGQSLGPLKINVSEVVQKINQKTASFKGMKVPVKVTVDTESKEVDVSVGTPPTSELIKKELSLEKGSSKPNLEKAANIAIEQVIKIALMKKDSMTVNSLKAAVKNVIGSCASLGILIEGKFPKDVNQEVDQGIYDSLINSEKTEIDADKKALLQQQLEEVQAQLKAEQEKLKALEEAEKVVVEKPVVEEKAEEKAEEGKEEKKEGAKEEKKAPAKEEKKEQKK